MSLTVPGPGPLTIPGSGSPFSARATFEARARAFDPTLVNTWFTDCVGPDAFNNGLSNGGTVTYPNTDRGGVALLQSNGSANGVGSIVSGAPSNSVVLVGNPKTEKWWIAFRLRFNAVPDANLVANLGLMPVALNNITGLVFNSTGANAGTLKIAAAGGVTVNTTWALDTANFHEFVVTYDTVTMTAYVDGVVVGQAANSASVPTTAAACVAYVSNNGTTTNQQFKLDKAFCAFGAP